jgi:hypothetical protein
MRKVGSDKSGQWIGEAFGMLRRHPGPFLLMGLIYTLISQLPVFGFLITLLLGPAMIGGMLYAAGQASSGQTPRVGQMFRAFQEGDRITSFMALCLPFIALFLVMAAMLLPLFPTIAHALRGQSAADVSSDAGVRQLLDALMPLVTRHAGLFSLWMLVYVVLTFLASMLTFLAPARIMFDRMPAFAAMRESFVACRTNFAAYFLLAVLLFLISLGMMILDTVLATFLPRPLAAILAMSPFNVLVALVVFAMHRSIFDARNTAAPPADTPAAQSHTFEA